jgi:hypothetical protein
MKRWLVTYSVDVTAKDYDEAVTKADALILGFEQFPPSGSYVRKVTCYGFEVKPYEHGGGRR